MKYRLIIFAVVQLALVCNAASAAPAAQSGGMLTEANSQIIKNVALETEFVVCGGGPAGLCAAVAAARHGTKVVLVQARPMLGGNMSSEMRMGVMGAYEWKTVYADLLNILRFRKIAFDPVDADALRLVVTEVWGG